MIRGKIGVEWGGGPDLRLCADRVCSTATNGADLTRATVIGGRSPVIDIASESVSRP